ncbi:MAG: condensation domain-containing protein, partial [Blastocatellia bacterium]
ALAYSIETASRSGSYLPPTNIRRAARDGHLPLSFGQQRLWFLDKLEPGNVAYNLPVALRLSGAVNVASLQDSLSEIVRRHEVLRTRFPSHEGRARQVISNVHGLSLLAVDLSPLGESAAAHTRRLAVAEAHRPFHLGRGPLLRASLLRLSDEDHVLLFTMHHIVSDAWSMAVLTREVAALYESYLSALPSDLPELPIQYADYATWQRERMSGSLLDSELSYWKLQLYGAPPISSLPTDYLRPSIQSHNGATARVSFGPGMAAGLRALCQREGLTLFMSLLAAFQALLYRYTSEPDVVVGTSIANRTASATEPLIGFFVNTQALRTGLAGSPNWRDLLQRVREVALGAYAHQDLPFERLVEELRPERQVGLHPLFQVAIVLQNAPPQELNLKRLRLSKVEVDAGMSKFDLLLSVTESAGEITGVFEYATDLFEATSISRMAGHYHRLLEAMITEPERRVSEAPILAEHELQQLLIDWNDVRRLFPADRCIPELFQSQVEQSPEAVAVVFDEQQLSYGELNCRANQLAHHLVMSGVCTEDLVGICVDRSIGMILGILGILKAGGAFLPIDPSYPAARLTQMLQDARIRLLLATESTLERIPRDPERVVRLDIDWPKIAHNTECNLVNLAGSASLAYVIYTSGSTGRPKGVQVTHRGVCNLAIAQIKAFEIDGWSHV